MIIFGVGEVTGGIITGTVIDILGNHSASLFCCLIISLMTGITVVSIQKM